MTQDGGKTREQKSNDIRNPQVSKGDGGTNGVKNPDTGLSGTLKKFYKKYLGPQGESGHYTIIHDILVAIIIVLIIIIAIYGYTRTWPPVVVVESGSMQHPKLLNNDVYESSEDYDSKLGVIDTGDIVMVKRVNSEDDIITWAEGKEKGYKTYGEYGDVIIYDKNGKGGTPVIHRAIVYIRVNETNRMNRDSPDPFTFDVPEWGIYNKSTIEYDIDELDLKIRYRPQSGHDGYLTKGDNRDSNNRVDQEAGITDIDGIVVEQVITKWVVGVARGEVPWFGLIKLKLNNNVNIDQAPDNSWTNLKISMVLLLGVPLTLNVLYYFYAIKYGTPEEEEEEEGGEEKGKEKKLQNAQKSTTGKQLSKRADRVKIGRKGGH